MNALPALCIGRTFEEALEIVTDALPTVLRCELVWLQLPEEASSERARFDGATITGAPLDELKEVLGRQVQFDQPIAWAAGRGLRGWEVELPIGSKRGRLVVGRRQPLEQDTDRVLIRSAANLVGAALESARVLDTAHRKDEFLAMLGHELRNPLAPIITAAELLARHEGVAREQKVIERQARHLGRLVDDLLDISRVTSGHVELKSEALPLGTVLERATELAAPLVSRHRHTLRVDDAEGVFVRGDAVRLAQVFGNLLTNAAKFTTPEGRIEVTVDRSAPGRVRVSVRDNGRGIAREQQRRIFEPFVQAKGAHDAARGGLGLGLAIVKNLVERHGGSIAVESKGEGQGACFCVELPTESASKQVVLRESSRAIRVRPGVRVLVVDDNVDIAQLLSEALQLNGYATAIAHDAQAALDAWRRFAPQAGILDLGMPELDGYELARLLRVEHGDVPLLIAATGYGQPQDRARAAAAGFDCHLIKPVSVDDLLRVLDGRLGTDTSPAE